MKIIEKVSIKYTKFSKEKKILFPPWLTKSGYKQSWPHYIMMSLLFTNTNSV